MSPVPFSLASSSSSNLKFRGIMIGAAMVVKNMLSCPLQRYDAFLQTTHKMIHNAFLIPRLNNLVEFNSFRIQLTLGLFRSKYESYTFPFPIPIPLFSVPQLSSPLLKIPEPFARSPGAGPVVPFVKHMRAYWLYVACWAWHTIFSKNIKSLAYIRVSSWESS